MAEERYFEVRIPVRGFLYREVMANNAEEAISEVMANGWSNEDLVTRPDWDKATAEEMVEMEEHASS